MDHGKRTGHYTEIKLLPPQQPYRTFYAGLSMGKQQSWRDESHLKTMDWNSVTREDERKLGARKTLVQRRYGYYESKPTKVRPYVEL